MTSRVDSMIAKGTGVMKGLGARMHGLQGVFRTLAEQHGEVAALLKRVQGDDQKRAELWPKIRQELMSHEQAELREVYPALRERVETRALADHHDREAGELSVLIGQLDATPPSSSEWGALFDQLVTRVEHHVHEEEHDIFPRAQDVIGVERAKQLEPRFLAAKQQLAAAV